MTAHACPSCRCSWPRVVTVTPAQRRVVDALLLDGCDNATAARRTGMGVETAKSHLQRVMGAAGTPSRTSLCVALLRGELVLHTTGAGRRAG